MWPRRAARLWLPAYLALIALLPILGVGPYVRHTLLLANLNLVFVLSWDLFSGPSGETNFGHSFFIGAAAYLSACLQTRAHLPPWICATIAVGAVAAFGAGVGWASQRLNGAPFALATMSLQLMFFQALYLLPGVFHGEQGIQGVQPICPNPVANYYLVVAAVIVTVVVRARLHGGPVGLVLRAVGDDDELARASGVRSRRWRAAAFSLGAGLGALGGVLYAHTLQRAGTELASSDLSVRIVLLALVGGGGTGPALVTLGHFLLIELLSQTMPGGHLLTAVLLLAAVILFRRDELRGFGWKNLTS